MSHVFGRTVIEYGPSFTQFRLDHVHPLFRREIIPTDIADAFVIAEVVYQRLSHPIGIGTGSIRAITHVHRHTAGIHQFRNGGSLHGSVVSLDVLRQHVLPVESSIFEIKGIFFSVCSLVGMSTYSLFRIVMILHHHRHCRGNASGHGAPRPHLRAGIVIGFVLIPADIFQQRSHALREGCGTRHQERFLPPLPALVQRRILGIVFRQPCLYVRGYACNDKSPVVRIS